MAKVKRSDPEVNLSITKRFWTKVDVRGYDDCWEWTGHRTRQGYGSIWADDNIRSYPSHRLSLLINGIFPNPQQIALHSCDNPPCCNPAHLEWGDHKKNAQDRYDRGRGCDRKGEKHPLAKLTADDVRHIRSCKDTAAEISKKYGIKRDSVYTIRNRVTWKHI